VTVRALIVFALLAAIIVPVVLAEMRRLGPRRPSRPAAAVRAPKREAGAKPPLRLVVNKSDMDRELAALLAKDSRKGREPDE
jgi:predicted lipid-binding transport protein (Tim44 family)